MEVQQKNFVRHLIITVQYYIIDYLKNRLLKFGQIIIWSYSIKLSASL